jgi:hypothetical protein
MARTYGRVARRAFRWARSAARPRRPGPSLRSRGPDRSHAGSALGARRRQTHRAAPAAGGARRSGAPEMQGRRAPCCVWLREGPAAAGARHHPPVVLDEGVCARVVAVAMHLIQVLQQRPAAMHSAASARVAGIASKRDGCRHLGTWYTVSLPLTWHTGHTMYSRPEGSGCSSAICCRSSVRAPRRDSRHADGPRCAACTHRALSCRRERSRGTDRQTWRRSCRMWAVSRTPASCATERYRGVSPSVSLWSRISHSGQRSKS